MRHLRAACHSIRVSRSLYQRIQAAMPKVVVLLVTLKNELVAHIITRTHARIGVSTILPLQLRIEFLVNDRYLNFILFSFYNTIMAQQYLFPVSF